MWNIDGGCISVTSGHRWAVDLPHTGMQTSTATARGNHTHRRRNTSTDKLTIADIIMAASPPLRSRRLVAVLAFVVGSALLVTPATADDISARRRRVLVTGASRGIGREIASKLAACGDCVCIGYCTGASHAEEALAALEGTGHCMVQADLSQPGEAQALVERAVAGLGGPLDVVVANHGIYEETPIAETPLADWCASFERVLRINLMAPAELAHCAASHMGADGGAIVFVSSRGAYRGEPDAAAYGASKAGLNSLTARSRRHSARVGSASPPSPPAYRHGHGEAGAGGPARRRHSGPVHVGARRNARGGCGGRGLPCVGRGDVVHRRRC